MKHITLTLAALVGVGFAAQQSARVLKIESKSFTGDLRNGPYTFSGSATAPIQATVSTLKISAPRAVMAAPAGTPITNAEGKRTAEFSGNVTVVRGRLTAKGPSLSYSEVSGAGVLKGGASATYTPEKKDDDVVNINATSMSFDVDTDMSTSEGGVKLVSGAQTGNSSKLVFDEKKELGLLTGNVQMNRAARGKQKALAITGEEARILTTNKLLYVKGKIRLVSGDTTTTGNEMFYDDKKNLAVIVGSAVSTNAKEGTRVTGNVLEQRIDLGRVRQLTGGYKIPTDQFKLSTEK
jgi:lipopolysaccharide export system protein LptA